MPVQAFCSLSGLAVHRPARAFAWCGMQCPGWHRAPEASLRSRQTRSPALGEGPFRNERRQPRGMRQAEQRPGNPGEAGEKTSHRLANAVSVPLGGLWRLRFCLFGSASAAFRARKGRTWSERRFLFSTLYRCRDGSSCRLSRQLFRQGKSGGQKPVPGLGATLSKRAVETVLNLFRCAHHGTCLVFGFQPFRFWHGVGHDAGAGLHVQHAVLDDAGADGDRNIHLAAE